MGVFKDDKHQIQDTHNLLAAWASSDFNKGKSIDLKYRTKNGSDGTHLEIEVPELKY